MPGFLPETARVLGHDRVETNRKHLHGTKVMERSVLYTVNVTFNLMCEREPRHLQSLSLSALVHRSRAELLLSGCFLPEQVQQT